MIIGDIPAALTPVGVSPSDTLYVADRDLKIAYVNDEWRSFARANNGGRVLAEGWNSHLLANFSGSEKVRWAGVYKALLSGRLPFHEESFHCPSPVERRTYRMRIVPHRDETGAVLWLIHHAVRLDLKPPTASGLKERLQALDMDPKLIMAAYRAQVMERLIRPLHFGAAQLVQPLEEVGGDLLWHHEYEDGTTHLVLADVMGHGLEAARLAAKLVMMLDSIAETRRSGAENVATLNRLLLDMPQISGEPELHPRYATGLYLCLSPDDHYLKVCSFGHSGPIFSKAGHFAVEGGLPIGMMEEEEPWPEETLHLATHGRRFLIFTDGVTEQFNMDGEMFGEAGLEREFHRTLDLPLPRMVEQTSACIDAFRGQALVKDDRALLGLESMA